MRERNRVLQEMKALYARLAELDLIIDSLRGRPFTYLELKQNHFKLENENYALQEQKKLLARIGSLSKEYNEVIRGILGRARQLTGYTNPAKNDIWSDHNRN